MSKRLTKLTITVLSAMMFLCMAIGLTTIKAYAEMPIVDTFIMVDGASVRTQDPMGIRFAATISSEDYKKLSGGEFGVMITPADFLDNLEGNQTEDSYFKHGVMAAYVDETTEGKYFNYATVVPSVNEKNADEYVMTCSFVGIKEYNFSRPFAARAYCKLDGEYYYTNIIERAVYSVVADAVANNFIEDENAQTYFDGIIDKVHTKYDTLNVEYSSNVTENAIEAGENFTVKATVSAADGKSLPTAVVFNDTDAFPENEDGTLKANKFGEYIITAGVGEKTSEKTFNVTARSDTYIAAVRFTEANIINGTGKMIADVVDQGKVVENPTVTFKDNHAWGTGTVAADGSYTDWEGNSTYDKMHATYVDEFGASYTISNCTVPVEPVYYGLNDNYAHDGVVAPLTKFDATNKKLSTIAIKDVELTSDKTSELVRFQYIAPMAAIGTSSDIGPRHLQIVVQDAEDLSNYFWVSIIKTSGASTRAGIRTSSMGAYSNTYYGTSGTPSSSSKITGNTSGWALSGLPLIFNGAGLATENYDDYMIGLSMEGTAVYLTYNGATTKIWDLYSDTISYAKSGFDSTLSESMAWSGFSSNKVNIYIRGDVYYSTNGAAYLSFDKIAGQKTTTASVSSIGYVTTVEQQLPIPAIV